MRTHKFVKLVLATAMLSPVILTSECIVSEAADAPGPYRVPPPPPPLFYNWTGLYVGAHVGGGFANLGVGDTGSGVIGGAQVGYNYQVGQYVWGLEADVSGSGVKNNLMSIQTFAGPITANFNWNSLTTLTPRLGYAFDSWLVYGKAGGAWADVSVSMNAPGFGFAASTGGTASGWVVGVGAEYAFRNNWSAKVEYNHYDFGSDSGAFFAGSSVSFDAVKAGINYKFGGPGGAYFPF
jgi:outer membrane immunogenic protein